MTIGKKLAVAYGAMLLIMIGLGWSSLSAISGLSERFDDAANVAARKIVLSDQVNTATSDMLALQRGTLLYFVDKSAERARSEAESFRQKADAASKALAEMRPLLVTEEGRRLVDSLKADLSAWSQSFEEMRRMAEAGDAAGALGFGTAKTTPLYESTTKAATRLTDIQRERLESDKTAANDEKNRANWIGMLLFAIGGATGIGGLGLVRQINNALRQIAGEMSEGAAQVAGAAAQVSSASQSLAQGASEQAARLEETSSSAEEISSMTRKNAENSQSAAQLMVQTAEQVAQANRKLDQMLTSMDEINASSDKISKIIRVIDEIAFQTNILALNAAVEAARAGEAGMGFAVVADEVRNLAQRCAQAARDTAALIEESIAKTTEGSARLDQVTEAIGFITTTATKVRTLVDEVNLGSKEQSHGIEQVARAVSQMEQVTQRTAANAEEGASAGEELTAQSDALRVLVERLGMMVGGEAGRSAVTRERMRGERASESVAGGSTFATVQRSSYGATAPKASSIPLEDEFQTF
jgi:methyl-accepting chemotaxis protein